MSHTALSFHCMICFDQFDAHTKYPVVLPCGHTYICVDCASRIDKCMECRVSLFTTNNPSNNDQNNNPNVITSRWDVYEQRRRARAYTSYTSSARSSPRVILGEQRKIIQPKVKSRLPLPKNVVLLSLIEASNLANQTTKQIRNSPPSHSIIPSLSSDEDEEMEQHKILMSMDLATSSCGTYAVAKKSGLVIVPNMDDIKSKSCRRLFVDDSLMDNGVVGSSRKLGKKKQTKEMHLNYGDRVQVVTIVNNWAKLARGYGYVHIENANDIIKVGGVLDKACNIESMLYILSFRRRHLIDQKECIERDAVQLMEELQDSIIKTEDLTVIGAEAFAKENEIIAAVDARDDKTKPESHSSTPNANDTSIVSQEPVVVASMPSSPREPTPPANSLVSWIGEFFNSINPASDCGSNDSQTSSMFTMFTRVDEQNYQTLLASAESWRRRNGREAERGIDFRTGLSGHLGALGHHASKHAHHDVGSFKISTHGGLTPGRRTRKNSQDNNNYY